MAARVERSSTPDAYAAVNTFNDTGVHIGWLRHHAVGTKRTEEGGGRREDEDEDEDNEDENEQRVYQTSKATTTTTTTTARDVSSTRLVTRWSA